MISAVLSLILAGFVLHQDETIDLLVAGINNEPFWGNGLQPHFNLPEDASPREVAVVAIGSSGIGFAKPKRPFVLIHCSKSVTIDHEPDTVFTMLHCYSTVGERIVMLAYLPDDERWYARVFDAKGIREAMKNPQ